MLTPSPRARVVRRFAVVFALGLLLSILPAPGFTFLGVAVVEFDSLPGVRDVGAAEVDVMNVALSRADEWVEAQGGLPPEDEPEHDEQEADHSHDLTADDRVVATRSSTDDFQMIGMRLDEEPDAPIMVRAQGVDGEWGDWAEMHVNPDEGPDPGSAEDTGAVVTEPVWVGDATAYQVSVDTHDVDAVSDVALVRERTERSIAEATPLAGSTEVPPFPIHQRSEWGARSAKNSPSIASSLKLAVVHHTVSPNGYSQAQVPGYIRSVQAYHMDANGWSDIGYNFVVDRFGNVWEGRGGGQTRAVIGAHAAGFNTGSVGVVALGTYTSTGPSSGTIEGISRVVGWRMQRYDADPHGSVDFTSKGGARYASGTVVNLPRVVGHGDVGRTSCPGLIRNSLGSIRNRAGDWYRFTKALHSPSGQVPGLEGGEGTITATGWAWDPDTPDPIQVIVIVDGRYTYARANHKRPDWRSHYPQKSNQHGFSVTVEAPEGTSSVCVKALNVGEGRNNVLRCADVVVK